MPKPKVPKRAKKTQEKKKVPRKLGLHPHWKVGEVKLARVPVGIETTSRNLIRNTAGPKKFTAARTETKQVHYLGLMKRTGQETFVMVNQITLPYKSSTFSPDHKARIASFFGLESFPERLFKVDAKFVQNLKHNP